MLESRKFIDWCMASEAAPQTRKDGEPGGFASLADSIFLPALRAGIGALSLGAV